MTREYLERRSLLELREMAFSRGLFTQPYRVDREELISTLASFEEEQRRQLDTERASLLDWSGRGRCGDDRARGVAGCD